MLSRKSLSVLTFAALTLIVLIVTSKRLGAWSGYDVPYYYKQPSHETQHAPQGSGDVVSKPNTTTDEPPLMPFNQDFPPRPNKDPLCDSFPDTSGILVIMKTGASESFGKLPTQLMTVLKCLPDFLLFSDMEQHIAGYHIHDSLESVLPEAKEGNPDFDLYRRQRWCVVDQTNCNKLGDPASEGWNLDKYKNLHMAEKAYQMKPGYEWYVFVDADTYVLWPNMVQWLGKLKTRKPLYLGSVAMVNNFPFGHGGSGYVVNKAAMDEFAGKHPGVANRYDVLTKNECCGDYVFALAMKKEADISVQNVWPTINGEKPSTLPFGPSHWCHPIVTMHHVDSEEISSFWEFERRRYGAQKMPSTPKTLLLKDIYTEFLAPKLQKTREDWDNLANNRFYLDLEDERFESWQKEKVWDTDKYTEEQKHAHRSFAACAAMCESLGYDQCFQYKYEDGICMTGNAISLGKPVKKAKEESKRSMSGWDIKKIHSWIADQGDCTKIHWPDVKN